MYDDMMQDLLDKQRRAAARAERIRQRREYLKKRIIYECWVYKKGEGGLFHSSAYRKRYFIVTVDQHLRYYDDPECYYQEVMPNGELSCIGMQCLGVYREVTIEGKVCFPFTIQVKEEKSNIRHCACETHDEREKLLASMRKVANACHTVDVATPASDIDISDLDTEDDGSASDSCRASLAHEVRSERVLFIGTQSQ